jgi:GTP-binding protein
MTQPLTERFRVRSAEFIMGAAKAEQLITHQSYEFALLGRSNVGKSTFLNRLCNQKHLARVSSTPGRTQELNLFKVSLKDTSEIIDFYLCDLPGYGFAKIPQAKKRQLENLLYGYITSREELKSVMLLVDARRTPAAEERQIRDLIFASGKQILTVITKSDKLSKNELNKQKGVIAKALLLEPSDLVVSGVGQSVQPVWERLIDPFK